MASCKAVGLRFLRVSEDEINQIVDNAMYKSIKTQTNWCTGILKGNQTKQKLIFHDFIRV